MRKLLVIALCCLAVTATRCSRKPKSKAVARPKPDSVTFAERVKELEFDFPAEAQTPLTEPEVIAYANALPGVVAALKADGFKAPYLEDRLGRHSPALAGWPTPCTRRRASTPRSKEPD